MSSLAIAARTLIKTIIGVIGNLSADERDELVVLIRRELQLLEQVAAEERRRRQPGTEMPERTLKRTLARLRARSGAQAHARPSSSRPRRVEG